MKKWGFLDVTFKQSFKSQKILHQSISSTLRMFSMIFHFWVCKGPPCEILHLKNLPAYFIQICFMF